MKASTAIRYLSPRADWYKDWGKRREESATRLAIAALNRDQDHAELIASLDAMVALDPEFLERDDSPGHLHSVAGVWDASNGPPDGGTPCEVCQAWIRVWKAYRELKGVA